MEPRQSKELTRGRVLAGAEDWQASEVVCRAGQGDRPFEEQHSWITVAVVLEGIFTYRSAPRRALMTPGSLLLGNAGACFECGHEHGSGDRCVAFKFAPDLFEEIAAVARARHPRFKCAAIPPLERLLPVRASARHLTTIDDKADAEEIALSAAVTALTLAQDAPARATAQDESRVVKAMRTIHARYAEPLSVAALASEVGLQARRFSSLFRLAIGVTPYNYLLNRRLDAAAKLLRETHKPVIEIAFEVGFGDLSEFTRRFGRRLGKSPGTYGR